MPMKICAHQFATLAGMRAALEGIFTRFDPAVLEAKLAQKSMVDSLLPSMRKARMWELFNEMYRQLAAEASDDFHELFGKAFLRAYEEAHRPTRKAGGLVDHLGGARPGGCGTTAAPRQLHRAHGLGRLRRRSSPRRRQSNVLSSAGGAAGMR